jgi:integrase
MARGASVIDDADSVSADGGAVSADAGFRDATMALVAYRHGLRAPEVVDLRWDQIDFKTERNYEQPCFLD